MKRIHLCLVGLLCSALLLSACGAPNTPQGVAEAFWDSVIDDDAETAVKYSTLADAGMYDGFSQNWSGVEISFGKVVVDGDRARIVSALSRRGGSGADRRTFVTHLIRRDGDWKVHYAHTGADLRGGPLAALFGQINQLGKALSEQLRTSSEDINREIERLSERFAELSESIGREASASIERFAEQLRRRMRELAESVDRASREQKGRLSDRDKSVLREVAFDLNEGSERLSRPSMRSIADGSESLRRAQRKLATTDDAVVGRYKEQWRELAERVEADMRRILEELSVRAEPQR